MDLTKPQEPKPVMPVGAQVPTVNEPIVSTTVPTPVGPVAPVVEETPAPVAGVQTPIEPVVPVVTPEIPVAGSSPTETTEEPAVEQPQAVTDTQKPGGGTPPSGSSL